MESNRVPPVSIGLPVYNGENYLERALESILSQSFNDFELIICDNQSTDRTAEICRDYLRTDSRVRYYRNQENLGAARNFNLTFDLARGRYFKWAAHDDLLRPDFLARCVRTLDQEPDVVLCTSQTQVIDSSDEPIRIRRMSSLMSAARASRRLYGHLCIGGHICYPVFGLFRSEVLGRTQLIGRYVESDQVLLAEIALAGRIVEISDQLFMARQHPDRSIHIDLDVRQEWFDSNGDRWSFFPKWMLFNHYLRAIYAARLDTDQKLEALLVTLLWAIKWFPSLKREIRDYLRHVIQPYSRGQAGKKKRKEFSSPVPD